MCKGRTDEHRSVRTFPTIRIRPGRHLHQRASYCSVYRPAYRPLELFLHGGSVKSLLDPTFKYVPSVETDIRKTFTRVRREARRQPPVLSTNDRSSKIAVLFGDKSFADKKRAL